jgi:chemotaxis protein CheZ
MTADASHSGDDSELEELFDSIALAPKPASPTSGDSVELEQLFDSIALAPGHTPSTAVAEPPADEAASVMHNGDACPANRVINSVGHLTRQLHDTLAQLGYDQHIQECAAATLPDARQRLAYVVALTEQAASRSLNAVDLATPVQEALAADAASLAGRWDSILRGEGSVGDFKTLAQATRDYLRSVPQRTDTTREQLREIVMAQEFQDLTGQVLKRITDLANNLETQLLTLLVENAPAPIRKPETLSLLNGPVVGGPSVPDVVANQAQVDELLESLGF